MKKIFFLLLFTPLLLLFSCKDTPKEVNLNIMSFNIRYDNPQDSINGWEQRKDVATKVILDNNIDVLGAQEVLKHQADDLLKNLGNYSMVGVGREDGKEKGEYSSLFYRNDKFTEIESGYYWLSETPEIAGSKGWDGACERMATWAILKDNETGKEFFFTNTHLDHIGIEARREGINLLHSRIATLSKGLPVIATGDFNAEPESDVIKNITDPNKAGHLFDSRLIATTTVGTEWTFHDFGRLPIEKRECIDYIFVSDIIEVSKYEVLADKLEGKYVSDHCPILIQASF